MPLGTRWLGGIVCSSAESGHRLRSSALHVLRSHCPRHFGSPQKLTARKYWLGVPKHRTFLTYHKCRPCTIKVGQTCFSSIRSTWAGNDLRLICFPANLRDFKLKIELCSCTNTARQGAGVNHLESFWKFSHSDFRSPYPAQSYIQLGGMLNWSSFCWAGWGGIVSDGRIDLILTKFQNI